MWKSSKQMMVADLTCGSEYIAVNEATKEATWLKNFISDLGVVTSIKDSMNIFYENEAVINLTKEPKDYGNSIHIQRKYHYVGHHVQVGSSL